MPSTQSTLKRPASSKPLTPSLKRPASSINDTVKKMKQGTEGMEDKDEKNQEGSDDEGDETRDKSKGQKYAKMRDTLPNYVQDLIEQQGKKTSSPREWKTKCINKLFVRDASGKLQLNLSDNLFQEHRKIFSQKFAKEEDVALPESIMKGLYFGNSDTAMEAAKQKGDIEEVEYNGKAMWKFTEFRKGVKTGSSQEQVLTGKSVVNKEQEKLLKAAFEGIGWDWHYTQKPKDVKIFEQGNTIPKSIMDLVSQAADSQSKLMKEAMSLIKNWAGGKDDEENLVKLKRGHTVCQTNLAKLGHMRDFKELPDGLESKKKLDTLMTEMANHTQSYNKLIETSRGLVNKKLKAHEIERHEGNPEGLSIYIYTNICTNNAVRFWLTFKQRI